MDRLEIVGLGMSTLDVLIRLEEMPSWERGGSFQGFGLDGGGPVGTACVAAARLGARVGYVGTAGNDLAAELKLRSFRDAGVDLSRLAMRNEPEGQVILVHVHAGTGERVFSGYREFSSSPLRPDELDRDYILSADILHLEGFHHEAAMTAAAWMREAGKLVSLDCAKTGGRSVSPGTIELIRRVDLLICGSGFGRALTGEDDPWKAGEAALELGPSVWVQTEGERGSFTVTREECFHTPADPVNVLDTTGAGDVFHGAYLAGLLRGWDLRTVARFATAVSALKCTKLGGRKGIPTFPETTAFLRAREVELPAVGSGWRGCAKINIHSEGSEECR